ncbi:site-specific integrase [Cuneatibacter sp. NSJ-177]|uniref:tyrosine-type recombinase/integrase n=1 Tax=Cuneatibacter sp. NSJ-177 TaxID=2931401 RepID=UPI001FD3F53A|nr:site-specific integrase [Cuneatibacter sp. NSJ-177]MCJ7833841.1 site-specific integrase [Cuneatibacter sp. NSJ-177]
MKQRYDKEGNVLPKGITQRPDGRYSGRFMYQGEPYIVSGDTIKKTIKALDALRYEVEHGIYAKESNITVDAWFKIWMDEYKANSVKASTAETYRQVYDAQIRPHIGKKQLKSIRPEMIQRLINQYYGDGLSKTRVNLPYIVLLNMYKQAERNGIVQSNPVSKVVLPKFVSKKERRVMSKDEQDTFLKYAASSQYYDIYLFALSTGMRINEILALQWQDIDFKKKVLQVNGTLVYLREQGKRIKDAPKTESSRREIPILNHVEALLKSRKKQQLENRLRFGEEWGYKEGLENTVFTDSLGKTIWDTQIRKDMQEIIKSIRADGKEFDTITPHTFRHTFATRALENGMKPKVVQMILGHSTLAMTMDLYSHVLPDTKAEEMQKLAHTF